jgi:hypothetical protein
MLIVQKFKKPGAAFATVDEALVDANSSVAADKLATYSSQEQNFISSGFLMQPTSFELVGNDTLVAVTAANRLPTQAETDYLVSRTNNPMASKWEMVQFESDGQPLHISNGRFYLGSTLVPYYPS